MLERLKDFGLDTSRMRVQWRLHTKAILVDGERVLFGSHNLTNMGALYNRDASLLVRDAEVTAWFEHVFLFDWEVLARQEADERVGGLRVARADEATPVGFRRVSLGEVMAWA
jgi:phosphatidylserine/phosphatidylglycerophosphate/cardiolipin synthase-like enzyme